MPKHKTIKKTKWMRARNKRRMAKKKKKSIKPYAGEPGAKYRRYIDRTGGEGWIRSIKP